MSHCDECGDVEHARAWTLVLLAAIVRARTLLADNQLLAADDTLSAAFDWVPIHHPSGDAS